MYEGRAFVDEAQKAQNTSRARQLREVVPRRLDQKRSSAILALCWKCHASKSGRQTGLIAISRMLKVLVYCSAAIEISPKCPIDHCEKQKLHFLS